MKKIQETGTAIAGVNISPIINVSFVLVIVMLLTAPVLNIPNMELELPVARTVETKERNITVSMGADGRLAIDEQIVTLADLPRVLDAKLRFDPNIMVIVRADKNLMYVSVESLIHRIKSRTRVKKLSIATVQRVDKIMADSE